MIKKQGDLFWMLTHQIQDNWVAHFRSHLAQATARAVKRTSTMFHQYCRDALIPSSTGRCRDCRGDVELERHEKSGITPSTNFTLCVTTSFVWPAVIEEDCSGFDIEIMLHCCGLRHRAQIDRQLEDPRVLRNSFSATAEREFVRVVLRTLCHMRSITTQSSNQRRIHHHCRPESFRCAKVFSSQVS